MVFPITSAVEGTGSPAMSEGLPTQRPVAVIPNRRGKKLCDHIRDKIWVKEKIAIGSTCLDLLQTSSNYSCARRAATKSRNFSGIKVRENMHRPQSWAVRQANLKGGRGT